jgi:uncharacterized protein YbgA (DUF1722 family)/uncharacterized protein YbbK (DUF523 family)
MSCIGLNHEVSDWQLDRPIRIGISACLLGEAVRFDGGHKREPFLTETLGPYVEWISVCPEVELGLGTPRESIRLTRAVDDVLLLGTKSGADHTARMRRFARQRVAELARADLDGYVLKKDSPSCGLYRVRVYEAAGRPPLRNGRGLFAEELVRRLPELPVEEEGRLSDPRLRENWVERVFAHTRLKQLFRGRWTLGDLVAFHAAHKLQLMSHSVEDNRRLGRLVAGAHSLPRADLCAAYASGLMTALTRLATTRKHTNVLQHAAGHLKKLVDRDSRAELADLIHDYRAGLVPLVVPITLIRHHVRRLDVTYLADQTYLEPHPNGSTRVQPQHEFLDFAGTCLSEACHTNI